VRAVLRIPAVFALFALPLSAAPLPPGEPALSLRLEGMVGQPTTLLGARGGVGIGAGYRLTDQLSLVADVAQRAAPRGGISSVAVGLQATLDMTPVAPYLELAVVDAGPRETLGYSLATRTGLGADWFVSPRFAVGLSVRTFTALDAMTNVHYVSITGGGTEAALRLVYFPGGK
jgi:hypothetical protein